MDVTVDDSSVVKIIHEYLLSRKLFFSADALVKESGVTTSAAYQGEQLMTLREYAIEGRWNDAKEYLQVLSEILDAASYKQILYLLFRQKYCELCFGPDEASVESSLRDTVVELQTYFSEAEKEAMMDSIQDYFNKQVKRHTSTSLALVTRLECYHELAQIVGPIFSTNGLQQASVIPSHERLVSAMVKGMLYDKCLYYCKKRASHGKQPQFQEESCDDFLDSTSLSNTNNLILERLQTVKEDHLFRQPVDKSKLEVRVSTIPLQQSDVIPSPSISPERVTSFSTSEQVDESVPRVSQAWEDTPTFNPVLATVTQAHSYSHDNVPSSNTHPPPNQFQPNTSSPETMGDRPTQNKADVRDSYADFMAEQAAARQESDRVLRELQVKEEHANMIRQNLQIKKEPQANISAEASPTPQGQSFPLQYVPVEKTEEGSAIRAIAFHPYGHVYAVGSNARNLKICAMPKQPFNPNVQRQKYQAELGLGLEWTRLLTKCTHVHKGSIYALSWNGDGTMITSCSNDKMIKLFDFDFETNHLSEPTFELAYHEGVVRDVTFLRDFGSGSVLASCGSGDCKVFTYDCEVDTMLHKLTGHVDQILSLYSWNNGMLASSSQDKSLRIWDLKSARCNSVLGFGTSPSNPAVPTSICVDASGRYLVAGRDDNMISVYDMVACKTLKNFEAHNGEVRSVRFNPISPNLLLSGSYDGTALVTNIDTLLQQDSIDLKSASYRCHHHTDKIIQCRWHPGGQSFASTSADHTCVLWSQQLRNSS